MRCTANCKFGVNCGTQRLLSLGGFCVRGGLAKDFLWLLCPCFWKNIFSLLSQTQSLNLQCGCTVFTIGLKASPFVFRIKLTHFLLFVSLPANIGNMIFDQKSQQHPKVGVLGLRVQGGRVDNLKKLKTSGSGCFCNVTDTQTDKQRDIATI